MNVCLLPWPSPSQKGCASCSQMTGHPVGMPCSSPDWITARPSGYQGLFGWRSLIASLSVPHSVCININHVINQPVMLRNIHRNVEKNTVCSHQSMVLKSAVHEVSSVPIVEPVVEIGKIRPMRYRWLESLQDLSS